MRIENITKLSEVTNNFNNIKIGLFTDNFDPSLLFFCNLWDETFFYYKLDELIIGDLYKSNIKFNVLLINKSLSSKSMELLFKYSSKYGVKVIYAPNDESDVQSQKVFINKFDFVVVNNIDLKNNLNELNSNILFIPSNLNEEYEFIKESGLFDEESYISKYKLIDGNDFDPILHYITLGIYENCNTFGNFDANTFLNLYPKIKEFDFNPFSYYVILKQLFKLNNFYNIDDILTHPSLFRLILWDKNSDILKNTNEYLHKIYENDFHFDLIEESNKLVFKQKNKFQNFKYDFLMDVISKTNLMIKNRSTGKRILKEINNCKVELTSNDLLEIGLLGIYDTYVQVSTLNKDFLFRIKFDSQNNLKVLRDKVHLRIFDAYETSDNYLAFKYQSANFVVESIDLMNVNNDLFFNGEITLLDDLNFDTVELIMFLYDVKIKKRYINCDYEKIGDSIKFKALLDFKYSSTDLNPNFKVIVRLKDDSGILLGSRLCNGFKVENLKNNLKKHVKKAVFFESFHGKFYSGQPKYIYEKMLDMGLDKIYDFVWAYNGNCEIPGAPLIIPRVARSNNYRDILGASDYWITNMSFPFLKPSEDIVYVQTTHGTPYKRMGADIESDNENITKGRVLIESSTWNYLLSPNDYSKEIFARSFEYDGEIINKGYPANDIFYEDTSIKEQKIKDDLNIDSNKKIILYCPTFRDYEKDNTDGKFSYIIDLEKLYRAFGEEYIILLRLHYSISKHLVLSEEMKSSIIDLSDYDDVADLYLISDILITDYSSVFFDFAHSKKPILFYVPDFEKYSSFRGLYSEVKENLPGPEIYTNDELIESIRNINLVKIRFRERYNKFYDKFCGIGHGDSSEEVINKIFGEVHNE